MRCMMTRVIISGTSSGIGKAVAELFASVRDDHSNLMYDVFGIDKNPVDSEFLIHAPNYHHYIADVRDSLPDIEFPEIVIANAGTQEDDDSIDVNLVGLINFCEAYADQPCIQAVCTVASASAHSGAEFPRYTASKGGVVAYTKNLALRVAKYGAVCNSISPGGVYTPINEHIVQDKNKLDAVLNEAILHRWASAEEIAQWIYFITAVNKSATAQDFLVDNGEMAKSNFIW